MAPEPAGTHLTGPCAAAKLSCCLACGLRNAALGPVITAFPLCGFEGQSVLTNRRKANSRNWHRGGRWTWPQSAAERIYFHSNPQQAQTSARPIFRKEHKVHIGWQLLDAPSLRNTQESCFYSQHPLRGSFLGLTVKRASSRARDLEHLRNLGHQAAPRPPLLSCFLLSFCARHSGDTWHCWLLPPAAILPGAAAWPHPSGSVLPPSLPRERN
ncbi:PREDICTED: uncharacterized protein LOC108541288 isoform X2 [Rhinopithecus bieti]|uniref:uncharacterized protein LOC108541288 isoform X2 n=1 Tax=Rhinopithecus bieti TaxID=61621 RepID=UPI00083BE876|nr:PREDICTED: uncharacterized protein LOC108541288 isoform X2 [Rhinopithecus bieti]